MLSEAKDNILPFWMDLKDEEFGSYYGVIDRDLNLNQKGDKGGIATARILWSFAAAYNTFEDDIYLEHSHHAYEFLINKVIDKQYGGLFWMMSYDGKVVDDRKHVYAQSFGIYALAEYYKASRNEDALEQAYQLFNLIENQGYNHKYQVYGEEYTKDWKPQGNEMLSENGVQADITTNTLLHILEAYSNLYQVTQNEKVGQRLKALVDIFINKVWNKRTNHMRIFFDYKWNEIIDLQSFGHDIEATWLVDDALRLLGLEDNIEYSGFVKSIADRIRKVAVEKNGSLMYENSEGSINRERVWWSQAEAIVGFINMYNRTNHKSYLIVAQELWEYTKTYIIDDREGGEWHAVLDEFGKPLYDPIVEPWKTPYHNLRACLEVYKRLARV